jgi:hypothetical protein
MAVVLRGRQDHLFFDLLKSDQSLDIFLLILDLQSILDHLIFNHFYSQNYPKSFEIYI